MSQFDRKIWLKKTMGKESLGKEDCPFCKGDDGKIIKKFKYWKIILNKFPYNGIKNHLLLIPLEHKEHTKELSIDEFSELKEIETYISEYYSDENYFSFIRQTNGGKSVKHLHFHYLPGTLFSMDLEKIMKNQHNK